MKRILIKDILFDVQGANPMQFMSCVNAIQSLGNPMITTIPDGITPEEEMIRRAGGLQLDVLDYQEI